MKKAVALVSFLFVFALASQGVLAEVEISYEEAGTCEILPYTYTVNITNRLDESSLWRVRIPREYSLWTSVSRSTMRLGPDETGTTEITFEAPGRVDLGEHRANITFMSEDHKGVYTEEEFCFIVLRDYSMHLEDFGLEKEEYGPGEIVEAYAEVLNDGTRDFDDGILNIKLLDNGEVLDEATAEFELETGKRSTVRASVELEELQEPGRYTIEYEVLGAGHTVAFGAESFEVVEVEDYRTEERSDGRYIVRTVTVEFTNTGNVLHTEMFEREMNILRSFLVTAEDAEVRREWFSDIYAWDLELEPGESIEVKYNIHYWPVYLLIVLLAVLGFRAHLYLKAPIVKKEVVESEISDNERVLTVSLQVKNRLFGNAKNVILEDSVPSVTRVMEDFETLEPSVDKKEDGTKLRWKLGEMDSRDSRVIHYKVKVLVESVDELVFPEAKVRGAVDGRTFERSSSEVRIGV